MNYKAKANRWTMDGCMDRQLYIKLITIIISVENRFFPYHPGMENLFPCIWKRQPLANLPRVQKVQLVLIDHQVCLLTPLEVSFHSLDQPVTGGIGSRVRPLHGKKLQFGLKETKSLHAQFPSQQALKWKQKRLRKVEALPHHLCSAASVSYKLFKFYPSVVYNKTLIKQNGLINMFQYIMKHT